jgi:hypothetical protein
LKTVPEVKPKLLKFSGSRKAGIPYLSDIPWNAHLCGFYETEQDMLDIVIPFLQAGLENNEYCMWIIPETLTPHQAKTLLQNALAGSGFNSEQIEILRNKEWYLKYSEFEGRRILNGWKKKVKQALAEGYDGLRICGNTAWLKERYWKAFIEYEAAINKDLSDMKIIALCTYQLSKCALHDILDIVNNHHFSFVISKLDSSYTNIAAKYERINLIGKMAASIAHEIRNPLTAVKGFLQLLNNKEDIALYRYYFKLMLDELELANSIISEYLSLARDNDKDIKKQDLNAILRAVLPLLQANALKEDKNVVLLTGDIEPLHVDAKDIRQVILNLAGNGLEAMQEGGCLTICTYIKNGYVVLEIQDTGSGIPQHVVEKLGEPFVTTKENGTGLGLPVSISILEYYNAAIKVHTSSAGTTIKVYFPAAG